MATVLKPDNLLPFGNEIQTSTWTGMCNVSVAQQHFRKYETLAPDAAIKIETGPTQKQATPNMGALSFRSLLAAP